MGYLAALAPAGVLAAQAPLEFRRTFFAGAFFNPTPTANGHMLRYLVAPLARVPASAIAGGGAINVLTGPSKAALAQDGRLQAAYNLKLDGDQGNPVALYLARAQHDVYTYRPVGSPLPLVATIVCIALSLDFLTDQAAWSSARRFESLFSKLLAFEFRIESNAPLTEDELVAAYQKAYWAALARLIHLVTAQVRAERGLATAAFCVSEFRLPTQLSPKIQAVLASGLADAGVPATPASLEAERSLFQLELKHMLNEAIVGELERRGARDVVMMPPESPWANGQILYLLKTRKGVASDVALATSVADSSATGYEIVAATLNDVDLLQSAEDGMESRVFGVRVGARLMRTPAGGGQPYQVPVGIADPVRKTALGTAGQPYIELRGATGSSRREVVLDGFRMACADLAKPSVDLILATSKEVNR